MKQRTLAKQLANKERLERLIKSEQIIKGSALLARTTQNDKLSSSSRK